METKIVQCVDCPSEFELTEGELNFYKEKQLQIPKRCKPCRKIKAQEKEERARKLRQYD